MRVLIVSPDAARAAIAVGWLGATPDRPPRLGTVALRPHQLRALGRLRRALDEFGGALLADAVGLGKTYVALALARDAHRPLVVAPAALRATWQRAAAAADVPVAFVSLEALARGAAAPTAPEGPDLLVVDEAHHARNPATRRWHALAALARHARVLLLTATPVHNRARDRDALLALFLGERARTLDPTTLARLVVRRTARDVASPPPDPDAPLAAHPAAPPLPLPAVRPTRWHRLPDAPAVLAALRAVPPPLPPRDAGRADALHALTLVQLWASSDAAARAALRRRLARAAALACALEQGRHLARADLRRWAVADDAIQLELALAADPPPVDRARLVDAIHAHERGLRRALAALDAAADARDGARAALLRELRRRHRGERIVAFTRFADTARALFRRLAPDGGVGLLTAAGGVVAGGRLSRRELVARFAPAASGVPPPRAAERVDLLVATDCLSEGLDLHDASIVVHLDVPWTPARLAQRVGRAARLGSPHPVVAVHGIAPPGGAAAWLRLGARLRAKAAAARRAIGAGTLSAGSGPAPRPDARSRRPAPRAPAASLVAERLERWAARCGRDDSPPPPVAGRTLAAAVAASVGGFLALCEDGGRPVLVAGTPHGVSDRPRAVARLVAAASAAGAPSRPVHPADVRDALRRLRRWARRRAAARLAGADPGGSGARALRRRVLDRVGRVLVAAPPHRRPGLAALAAAVRVAAEAPWSAALERAVAALAELPDDRWFPAVAGVVGSAPVRAAGSGPLPGAPFRVVTILLLRP